MRALTAVGAAGRTLRPCPASLFLLPLCALVIALLGCSRQEVTRNAPPALGLGRVGEIALPDETWFATKRGFCDVNGDGLTDMLEINDRALFGQNWLAQIFLGRRETDGLLHFTRPYTTAFPLHADWIRSSLIKLDTADVNGDGFCDVVMTQYQEGLRHDQFHIIVGMNQGDGRRFRFVDDVRRGQMPASVQILRTIESALDDDGDSSDLAEWFKMDWADADGDGRDDLWLFWRTDWLGRHLRVEIWPSTTPKGAMDAISLGSATQVSLPGFLTAMSVRDIDTEDMNGDGRADLVIYRPRIGTALQVAYARNDGGSLVVHRDFDGHEIEMDYWGFEKRDTFDINLDGCADYVHAGTHGRKRALSYLLAPCDAKPAPASPPQPEPSVERSAQPEKPTPP